MCGLAGFFRNSINFAYEDHPVWLKAMGDSLSHRGPDADGMYLSAEIALIHRRLSIIDLSEAGRQPMVSTSERFVMVFNGEIYNFRQLRSELEEKGVVFSSHSDTEVLLALYERERENALERLNGMYAFAVWDRQRKELFLARDRLGKKPLYYYHASGQFAFGSEIKALLQLPFLEKQLRPDAIKDFFAYQYIPDPKSIYSHVHKLPPGCWLKTDGRTVKLKRYWDLNFDSDPSAGEQELKSQLRELLSDAVRLRMISDVPLGAFLSGGIDSSAIVALMAEHADNPVTTCSIGFDSEKFDEVRFARKVADQFNTDHHEFTVKDNVTGDFEAIARYFDEPFADPSFVPTYFVSQLARKQVTVALAGDGGDENFAGYQKYYVDALENRLRRKIPGAIRHHLFPGLASVFGQLNLPLFRKARSLLGTLAMSPEHGFFGSNCFFDRSLWNHLVNPAFEQSTRDYDPAELTCELYRNAPAEDHLSRILYTDFKTYLPGDILVKVDRMSMANSLETRAPFLDYRVVEFAARVPAQLKLHGREKKHLLKASFAQTLTPETLYRKKMGFSVPLADWLRAELRALGNRLFVADNQALASVFRMDRVQDLWCQQLQGNDRFTQELWTMMMFAVWFEQYQGDG